MCRAPALGMLIARSLFLSGSPAALILLCLELSRQDQRAVGGVQEVTVD